MSKHFNCAVGIILGSLLVASAAFLLISIGTERSVDPSPPPTTENNKELWYAASALTQQVKLYLFNVTNPNEVANGSSMPILTKVGPFVLDETFQRGPILASPNDSTSLDYKLTRTYRFNRNSSLPLDTRVTLPNVVAFSAALKARKTNASSSFSARLVVGGDYLKNEPLYETHTADDWLFNGVKLRWLDAINSDGHRLDDEPPENKFGLYYLRNNSLLAEWRPVSSFKQTCNVSSVVTVLDCDWQFSWSRAIISDDLQLIQQVHGLAPVAAYFSNFLGFDQSFERYSGQSGINLEIGPTYGFRASKALKCPVVHPFIWFDQTVTIDDRRWKESRLEMDLAVERSRLKSSVMGRDLRASDGAIGYCMILVSLVGCIIALLQAKMTNDDGEKEAL